LRWWRAVVRCVRFGVLFVADGAAAAGVGAGAVVVCTGVRVVTTGLTTTAGFDDDFVGAGSGLGPPDEPLEGAASGPLGD
jgi:hypothetical protein